MHTVGMITEFNPFHKGHEYIIAQAKKQTNATYCIVVMSGSFVQRGEPAIFDKWTRAACALKNGADLVLELPVLFATAHAEAFAEGAIKVLSDTGMIDTLCFGSESGDLSAMQTVSKLMLNETPEFQQKLKFYLSTGISYPTARAKSLSALTNIPEYILSRPNHILGLEYLKALERTNSTIQPFTIRRKGSQYHDTQLDGVFASATAIRQGLYQKKFESAFSQVPENTISLLQKQIEIGKAPVTYDALSVALQYKLRTMSVQELSKIFEVVEGLENRIDSATKQCFAMEEMIDFIKSKRYTRTKIQRILTHILLHIQTQDVYYFLQKEHLPYIRVLGFQKSSADILRTLMTHAKCPVLTNLKNATWDTDAKRLFAFEQLATDMQALAFPNTMQRKPNLDFITPMAMT